VKLVVTTLAAFSVGIAVGHYAIPEASVQTGDVGSYTDSTGWHALDKQSHQQSIRVEARRTETMARPVVKNEQPHDEGNTEQRLIALKQHLSGLGVGDIDAIVAAYEVSKQLPQAELEGLVIELLAQPIQGGMKASLLVNELARRDPANALKLIGTYSRMRDKAGLTSMVLNQWGKQQPDEVLEYYIAHRGQTADYGAGELSPFSLMGAFSEFAKQWDSELWVEKLSRLKRGDNQNNLEQKFAISALTNQINDADALLEFYQQLQANVDVDSSASDEVLKTVATRSPDAFMDAVDAGQLLELDGDILSSQAIVGGLMSGSTYEKAGRASWLLSQAEQGSQRQRQASAIVNDWAYEQPEAAISWLDQQSGFDNQQVKADLIGRIAGYNPELAIREVESLESDELKKQASYDIYRSLSYRDEQQAEAFLVNSPMRAEMEQLIAEEQRWRNERANKRG